MSSRGYIVLRDADGNPIYTQLTINDTTPYRFVLQTKIGSAAVAAVDVSARTVEVHFRVSVPGTAAIPIDVTLTKTNGGSDGVVDGEARALAASFTAGAYVDAEVVLVDTATADANTPSGYREIRQLGGRWQMKVQAAINAT